MYHSSKIQGVPLWYVEDLSDARTKLAGCFSILLDGDGNGLNNIEDHTFGLFKALGPHPMGPIQHDTVGQHDRRELLDVVWKAIVSSPDNRQCLSSLAQR